MHEGNHPIVADISCVSVRSNDESEGKDGGETGADCERTRN